MWLPDQVFKTVISSTPLISIDLVVRNNQNQVLLGKRLNAPAKGFWFVPGGRVQKNETLDNAFIRLLREELGIESGIVREDANFLGVFEHFYSDNVFDDEVDTHYIVLVYEFRLDTDELLDFPVIQHSKYLWFNSKLVDNIHIYSQKYFKELFN